ncbi:MAG: tetratricopeptide repeat protein [Saprospiraceae bacterium]
MRQIFLLLIFFSITAYSCKNDPQNQTNNIPSDVAELNKLIDKSPDNASLLFARGKYFYDNSDYDKSIEDLKKAIEIDSMKPEYYHLLSDAYMDSAKSRFAIQTMKELVYKYPERIPSLLKLAELFFIVKEYDNSISTINSILYLSPGNPDAYFLLGVNFKEMGKLKEARNSLQTSVENNPEDIDAWLQLGQVAELQKDSMALTFYNNALLLDSTSIEALHHIAFYYQNNGDITKALETYREMSIKNPDYPSSYLNAGLLYMNMDSLKQAYDNFNILVNIDRANPKAYYYRGYVNYLIGNKDNSKEDFEQALKIAPDFTEAKEMLEKLDKR